MASGSRASWQNSSATHFFHSPQAKPKVFMWSKKTSGLIGMVVGGIWFLANVRHFSEQGFVAIALPVIIFALGVIYFRNGGNEAE